MATDRSPNYPADGLAATAEMAKKIWDKENRTVMSPEIAAAALGYKSLNGAARAKLSSLKKFGFLEEDSIGFKLSSLAMTLLHGQPDSTEYKDALKDAALKPKLFQELYNTHVKASDDAIKSYLMLKKDYSEPGAKKAISSFRGTLKAANLNGEAYIAMRDTAKPALGDYVQWESNGVLQFRTPRRIKGFSPDHKWAFVDGSETGIPVQDLTVPSADTEKTAVHADPLSTPPIFSEIFPDSQAKRGLTQHLVSLPEGQYTLNGPSSLSRESFEHLTTWLDLIKRILDNSATAPRVAK